MKEFRCCGANDVPLRPPTSRLMRLEAVQLLRHAIGLCSRPDATRQQTGDFGHGCFIGEATPGKTLR